MTRVRAATQVHLHLNLASVVAPTLAPARVASALGRYGLAHGIGHALSAGALDLAVDRLESFAAYVERLQTLGVPALERLLDDVRAVGVTAAEARLDTAKLDAWESLLLGRRHLLERDAPGRSVSHVLMQLALEHADDSPVTLSAERFMGEAGHAWDVRPVVVNTLRPATFRGPVRWSRDNALCVAHGLTRGGLLVVGTNAGLEGVTSHHGIRRWTAPLGASAAVVMLDPSRQRVAALDTDGIVSVWMADTGDPVLRSAAPFDPRTPAALVDGGSPERLPCIVYQPGKTIRDVRVWRPGSHDAPGQLTLAAPAWYDVPAKALRLAPDLDTVLFQDHDGHWLGWHLSQSGPPREQRVHAHELIHSERRAGVELCFRMSATEAAREGALAAVTALGVQNGLLAVGESVQAWLDADLPVVRLHRDGATRPWTWQRPVGRLVTAGFSSDGTRLHVLVASDRGYQWSVYDVVYRRCAARRRRNIAPPPSAELCFSGDVVGLRTAAGFRPLVVDRDGRVWPGPASRLLKNIARLGEDFVRLPYTVDRVEPSSVEAWSPGLRQQHVVALADGHATTTISRNPMSELSRGTQWLTSDPTAVVVFDRSGRVQGFRAEAASIDSVVATSQCLVVADRRGVVTAVSMPEAAAPSALLNSCNAGVPALPAPLEGAPLTAFSWEGDAPRLLGVSPTLVAAWQWPHLRALDVADWSLVRKTQTAAPHMLEVSVLAWDPCSRYVISAGYGGPSVKLWCGTTGTPSGEVPDPRHKVHRLLVASDGSHLAVETGGSGSDGEQWVWRLADRRLVARGNVAPERGRFFGPWAKLIQDVWCSRTPIFAAPPPQLPMRDHLSSSQEQAIVAYRPLPGAPPLPRRWHAFERQTGDRSGAIAVSGVSWVTDRVPTARLETPCGLWVGSADGNVSRLEVQGSAPPTS